MAVAAKIVGSRAAMCARILVGYKYKTPYTSYQPYCLAGPSNAAVMDPTKRQRAMDTFYPESPETGALANAVAAASAAVAFSMPFPRH